MTAQLSLSLIEAPATQAPSPAAAAKPAPRRCAWCTKRLPRWKRADARTCGKPCRQAKSRAQLPKVSRIELPRRHVRERALTRAALTRTGLSFDEHVLDAPPGQVSRASRPRGKKTRID
ncbi:MAG TPA: hypothetical protein VGF94_08025 [Kofleriaceae bacterium]|jgi:hypothetical protein